MLWLPEAALPLMVTLYVPGGVVELVAIVRVLFVPEVAVAGLKVAVAPVGRPEADRVTDCAAPEVTAVLIVVVAADPALTLPDVGDAATEKSFVGGGFEPAMAAPRVSRAGSSWCR